MIKQRILSITRLTLAPILTAVLAASSVDVLAAGAPLIPVSGSPPAADFALPDTEGNPVRLSDLRGKVVLLNFWATWCPPCRQEMPSMQTLWQELKDEDFFLLAINVGEGDDDVFAFVNEFPTPLSFPILMDKESSLLGDYSIMGLPTSFIIDKEGNLMYKTLGGREWDDAEVREILQSLMRR